MKKWKIRLNFVRDILGGQPADPEIKRSYIKAKMISGKTGLSGSVATEKIESEIENANRDESIRDIDDKSITVFYRDENGRPCISDVQLRGFVKDAFAFVARENGLLQKKDGSNYSGDAKYKKWIGDRIMFDRQYYVLAENVDGIMERPLRAETQMGPRVAITASELIKGPGRSIAFSLTTTDDVDKSLMDQILSRGMFRGIGQWNNAQWGTFEFELEMS